MSVFCNQCGHRNPEGSNFCSSCGAVLDLDPATATLQAMESRSEPAADDGIEVSLDDIPEGLGLLIVRRGPNAGSKQVLEKEVTTAGRHPQCDIFLDDITVSRNHAEFVRTGSSYVVRDRGSLNGTYVNRERADEATLHHGDEVQIGVFKLVFFSRDDDADADG